VPQPSLRSQVELAPIIFNKKYNFVYVGNIGHLQLILEIAQAGKLLAARNDIEIHLAGMGVASTKLVNFINENNLQGVVTYHGPLPLEKAERLYKNADGLIVTLKEGGTVGKTIPNKLVHYLKYARPILGALSGDGKDVLLSSGGAILTDQNAEGIAEGMEKIMQLSSAQKEKMGELNRRYYQENFELRKVAQLLEKELLATKNS